MANMPAAFAAVLTALAVNLLFGALLANPLQWIWNLAIVPAVPVVTQITWIQAWAAYVFVRLMAASVSFTVKV